MDGEREAKKMTDASFHMTDVISEGCFCRLFSWGRCVKKKKKGSKRGGIKSARQIQTRQLFATFCQQQGGFFN